MLDNPIINTAIGLFFVFFVFSLLVSGARELIAKWLRTRSKELWTTIRSLLDGKKRAKVLDRWWDVRKWFAAIRGTVGYGGEKLPVAPSAAAGAVAGKGSGVSASNFYNHPLIRRLDSAMPGAVTKLRNVEPEDFARTLLDLLGAGDEHDSQAKLKALVAELPDSAHELKGQLDSLLDQGADDLDAFRTAIEGWYDRRMDALSAWYRRRSRWVAFALGLAIAVAFNVNAIGTAVTIYEDDVIQSSLVAQSADTSCTADETEAECFEDEYGQLIDTGLPFGWQGGFDAKFPGGVGGVIHVFGWLITAAAIAQGAPFWSDLLTKLTGLRKSKSSASA